MNGRSLVALALAASLLASAASAALLSRGGDTRAEAPLSALGTEAGFEPGELPVDEALAAAGRACPC